jgi:hypothetical protein
MRYLSTFLVLLFIQAPAFSQTQTPQSGLELSASRRKPNVISVYDSPVFSNYLGFYMQVPFPGRFSIKFGAGLNLIYNTDKNFQVNWNGAGYSSSLHYYYYYRNFDLYPAPEDAYAISLTAEPRYELSPASGPRGSMYLALPLTFEGAPITHKWSGCNELKIIPSLGYRYPFNKHWTMEAGAGLGGGFYSPSQERSGLGRTSSRLEYALSLRLGYAF